MWRGLPKGLSVIRSSEPSVTGFVNSSIARVAAGYVLRGISGVDVPPAYSTSTEPTKVGRLNHVAIAVPDLARAAERFRKVLGAQVSEPQPLPEHGVTVVFINLPNTKLELLEPLGEKSPIASFLKKNPAGGLHHICLEVDDIKSSIDHVAKSVRVLDPEPKIGAHGTPVAFLHPKDCDGVLVELEQVNQKPTP